MAQCIVNLSGNPLPLSIFCYFFGQGQIRVQLAIGLRSHAQLFLNPMTLCNSRQDIEEQGNHKNDDIEGVEKVLAKKQQQPDGLWVKTNIGI